MKLLSAFVLSVLITCSAPKTLAVDSPDAIITRIACGSCAHQDKKIPIFDKIVARQPQIFLFTGDNIYGDTEDMDVLRKKYGKLNAKPGFAKLRATTQIIPAWDDHDYGMNDAGAEYPMKRESQKIFADFFKLPADSPVRTREGTYDVYTYGPKGKRVQIIVLDTRYFRSSLVKLKERKRGHGPYTRNNDPTSTILGDAQWKWLKEQLKTPTDVRFIVSSIQFVPHEHHWELWANFPHERQRMLELIDETKAGPVIIVSGDRHHSEISKMTTPKGTAVWDVTASSLARPGSGNENEPNEFRMSDGNYGAVNFGLIHIDWSTKDDPKIRAEILDGDGTPVFNIPMLGK